jgi:hypothetical protein
MPSFHAVDLLRFLVPITYMKMGHAYAVIKVLRSGDVIFVVMTQGLDTGYTVIELPLSLHWPLRRLLILNKLYHVNKFYLEYMGLTYFNESILRAHGGGLSILL